MRKERIGKYAFGVSLLWAIVLFSLLVFQGTPWQIAPLQFILFLLFSVVACGGFLIALVGLFRGPLAYSLIALLLGPLNLLLAAS